MGRRVAVVEDRMSFGPAITMKLREMGHDARWITHTDGLEVPLSEWRKLDLVLLDALNIDVQQGDPTRSRLVSLDLLEYLGRDPEAPCVVVYSTAMERPEVNIPVRGIGKAAGFYDVRGLTANILEIIEGRFEGQVAPPAPADWFALDSRLEIGADVAGAHQIMRSHPRSWRLVWDPHAPFDKAAQVWINRNVLPRLGKRDGGGYAMAVQVIRKISGLPFTLV